MSRQDKRVSRFVDDILRNRRPRRFGAEREDLDAMQAAAALRAARAGAGQPDPDFAERLARRLRGDLEPQPAANLSRRRLLTVGGAAAAALVAGVAADRAATTLQSGGTGSPELVPALGVWRPVAAVTDVPPGHSLRFRAGAIEGVVVNDGGTIRALSAVCTHLGCILQGDDTRRRLVCPCHRTWFSWRGQVEQHALPQAPPQLPLLRSRVRGGMVEVLGT